MRARAGRMEHERPMDLEMCQAFRTGYERLAAWADLIDRINVFPVADGDTGRNLVLSLSPLLRLEGTRREEVVRDLLMSSRGMSGNIGTRFFSEFLKAEDTNGLLETARAGREQAWNAVDNPRPGTILSLFDSLCDALVLHSDRWKPGWTQHIVSVLESSVHATTDRLPVLKEAGVVDAGAMGCFLFFEGFFASLGGNTAGYRAVTEVFGERLSLASDYVPSTDHGYCIDVVLEGIHAPERIAKDIQALGGSVVTLAHGSLLKAHLHTEDREGAQRRLDSLGSVIRMASDDLGRQTESFRKARVEQAVHIVTDGAASISRDDALKEGISILDSYVNMDGKSIPESCLDPDRLYQAMRQAVRVSTSQASVFERHQQYEKLTSLYPRSLYICVGSAYTGNYNVAKAWKEANDPGDHLVILDSGLASGKLGLAVLETARYSARVRTPGSVLQFAKKAVSVCQEYVFLDRLQYLAAGGRISKTSSFFGDLLHMKPVITPTPNGAEKVAVLRSRQEQLGFLLDRIREFRDRRPLVSFLLEFTDTKDFVEEVVWPRLRDLFPRASFRVGPLSNTSGAHMGPGTWGVAFLPEMGEQESDL